MLVLPQAPAFPARRLVEFAEPRADDVCLEVTVDDGPALAPALDPLVRDLRICPADALSGGTFTLVTGLLTLTRAADPTALAQQMMRVCRGRIVLAEIVRRRENDPMGARQSRQGLVELLNRAGARVRGLDVFTIERPAEPWLAQLKDARRIRKRLAAELDGGPRTGAGPRLLGDELWFTQSWACVAFEQATSYR